MKQIFRSSFNTIQDKSGTSNLPVFVQKLDPRFRLHVHWSVSGSCVNTLKSVLIKLIKTT